MDIQDGKSVMSGGSVKGWLPDVAAVLWLRMLGALGDINKISEPTLHLHVFQFLIELFETLMKVSFLLLLIIFFFLIINFYIASNVKSIIIKQLVH